MAELIKKRRLVNPGKRRLSPLQKLFFGTKRQRAAVKHNAGPRSFRKTKKAFNKRFGHEMLSSRTQKLAFEYGRKPSKGRKRRVARFGSKPYKRNISSIVSIYPNPGVRMKRKRRNPTHRRAIRLTRRKSSIKRRLSRASIGSGYKRNRGKKVVVINKGAKMRRRNRSYRRRNPHYIGKAVKYAKKGRYLYGNPGRRRRRNVMRRRSYRRNPGMFSSGLATKVLGVVGGVAVTKLLVGFLPASISTGVVGYAAVAAVAVLQGKLVGKVTKSPGLGEDMMIGGLAYLTAKILTDFLPNLGSYTGISGMGMIGPSSFYVPQVNQNGNMGRFVVPAAVTGAIPAPAPAVAASHAGVGRLRRMGRIM